MELMVNNILFIFSIVGLEGMFLFWTNSNEILLHKQFCFYRREILMEEVKFGAKIATGMGAAVILLYEAVGILWSGRHITPEKILFVFAFLYGGYMFLDIAVVKHKVWCALMISIPTILLPWIMIIVIFAFHWQLDNIAGSAAIVMLLLDVVLVKLFADSWMKGDF